MKKNKALRSHLHDLIDSGHAHLKFADAVKDFPPALRGVRPAGAPHSAWELLEHIRLALWDIVEFSRNPDHVSPTFPDATGPRPRRHRPRARGPRALRRAGPICASSRISCPTNRSTSTRASRTATARPCFARSSSPPITTRITSDSS